jgi:hypothetical protein
VLVNYPRGTPVEGAKVGEALSYTLKHYTGGKNIFPFTSYEWVGEEGEGSLCVWFKSLYFNLKTGREKRNIF